jgi:hypothetical protein
MVNMSPPLELVGAAAGCVVPAGEEDGSRLAVAVRVMNVVRGGGGIWPAMFCGLREGTASEVLTVDMNYPRKDLEIQLRDQTLVKGEGGRKAYMSSG